MTEVFIKSVSIFADDCVDRVGSGHSVGTYNTFMNGDVGRYVGIHVFLYLHVCLPTVQR